MTWLKIHQQKMLSHFLYLRSKDRAYALAALAEYDKTLYPTITKELETAWKDLQASSAATTSKESLQNQRPSKRPLES